MLLELNNHQCENLRDFIECYLFDVIRQDEEIDGMGWLNDMTSVWYKLDQLLKTTGGVENANE